ASAIALRSQAASPSACCRARCASTQAWNNGHRLIEAKGSWSLAWVRGKTHLHKSRGCRMEEQPKKDDPNWFKRELGVPPRPDQKMKVPTEFFRALSLLAATILFIVAGAKMHSIVSESGDSIAEASYHAFSFFCYAMAAWVFSFIFPREKS